MSSSLGSYLLEVLESHALDGLAEEGMGSYKL